MWTWLGAWVIASAIYVGLIGRDVPAHVPAPPMGAVCDVKMYSKEVLLPFMPVPSIVWSTVNNQSANVPRFQDRDPHNACQRTLTTALWDMDLGFDGVKPRGGVVHPPPSWLGGVQLGKNRASVHVGRDIPGAMQHRYRSRTFDVYFDWLKHVLMIQAPMVIHVAPEHVPLVKLFRCDQLDRTEIVATPAEYLSKHKYYYEVARIIQDPNFRRFESFRRPQHKFPIYNTVMLLKTGLLEDTATRNPFNSKLAFWVDAGFGHGKAFNVLKFGGHSSLPYPQGVFPQCPLLDDPQRRDPSKMFFVHVGKDLDCSMEARTRGYIEHNPQLGGGFFGGDVKLVPKLNAALDGASLRCCDVSVEWVSSALCVCVCVCWCSLHTEAAMEAFRRNLSDDDQAVFFDAYCTHPELFDLHHGGWFEALELFGDTNAY